MLVESVPGRHGTWCLLCTHTFGTNFRWAQSWPEKPHDDPSSEGSAPGFLTIADDQNSALTVDDLQI
jgi:hypothetical protein